MASKKRSLSGEGDNPVTKKRILSGENEDPIVNGTTDPPEPADSDKLENFRKEAIYRRMKHYFREHERSQSRIVELERRKNTCEAGLAAISACWSQLVETIRLLAKPDDLPSANNGVEEVFDLTAYFEEEDAQQLRINFENCRNATHALVSRLVEMGGNNLLTDETYLKWQNAQTECAVLRSQLDLIRKKLQDSEALTEIYREHLAAAENRCERLKSKSVLASHSLLSTETRHDDKGALSEKPPSPIHATDPGGQVNGNIDIPVENNLSYWQTVAEERDRRIAELDRLVTELRKEKFDLVSQVKLPSLELLSDNPHFKAAIEKISHLQYNNNELQSDIANLKEELALATEARATAEDAIPTDFGQQVQELKAMIVRKDTDISRLREIRDQQQAELNERKQKDATKLASLEQYKILADNRHDFIEILKTQLKLSHARLAASTGKEDVMTFLLGNESDIKYIQVLQERLTAAEDELAACRQAISAYETDRADVVAVHADVLRQLSQARVELQKYHSVYGDTSVSAESSALMERLRQKEEEAHALRLQQSQHAEAETSLYAELDKLSIAWEGLDRQLKNKIFDLSGLEERLVKSGLDRAKSENKYYQAVREKEAIEGERKSLQRVIDKHEKIQERSKEMERSLQQQLSACKQESEYYLADYRATASKLRDMQLDNDRLRNTTQAVEQSLVDIRQHVADLENQLESKRAELRKQDENVAHLKKEHERQLMKQKISAAATATKPVKDSELQVQLDEAMSLLKCSTCKQSMRTIVLSKCMHTFCKDCIDARLSTRQRKCPSCNLAFGQNDVLQIYFQ
ncbi:uncharacterized protein BT62DRAFT_993950 [Guyanagaster necrorhizus]|uniref:E3 ubiquitin protein ligase n=1 Tax=Guyanagaster necrorhizus TaxID=856835 RepID=A0A9P7VUE0_9AGAR|nr:uncharacterized protein BT62DRAFT_993950 [Guyanagaster necrorhizus MCA 3950]KAG7446279.1 hypothetical protein BT62DRAFT_993950 [Guyanagaster necrorhizus MCA 3950]